SSFYRSHHPPDLHSFPHDALPILGQLHMTEFSRPTNKFASQMESGKRYFVQSPFKFRKAGQSGVEICEHFEQLAGCVDDICFYRDRKSTRLNSSHVKISYAVFCLK